MTDIKYLGKSINRDYDYKGKDWIVDWWLDLETYSKHCQTSKMEHFVKVINLW